MKCNKRPILIERHDPVVIKDITVKHNHISTPIDPKEIRKILLVKLDHIGDMILALPAIKMLRMRFPNAYITMLSTSWPKDIVEKVTEIDEVMFFDLWNRKSQEGMNKEMFKELKGLEKRLTNKSYDLAIDLRRHSETRRILKLSSARYTIGYESGDDDSWLSLCLRLTEEIMDTACNMKKPHITSQICQLIRSIPIKDNNVFLNSIELPLLKFDLEREKSILSLFGNLFKGDFIVGIHPGCGSAIRQWPLDYFARLSDLLITKNNTYVIIFGDKQDAHIHKKMILMMKNKDKIFSLAGRISLDEFMYFVKKCNLFVGNNSGPCKVASFLGVPTLEIFSGQVSPYEWFPIGEKSMIVRLAVSCAPCYKPFAHKCPCYMKCLKLLWPEKVLEAIYQLLAVFDENVSGWPSRHVRFNPNNARSLIVGIK
jgi:lipopolysaccharide heptosyltransferase II